MAYRRALAGEGIRTKRQLKRRWLMDWYEHHAEVLSYSKKQHLNNYWCSIQTTPVKNEPLPKPPLFNHRGASPHNQQSAKRKS